MIRVTPPSPKTGDIPSSPTLSNARTIFPDSPARIVVRRHRIESANSAAQQFISHPEGPLKGVDVRSFLPQWPFDGLAHTVNTHIVKAGGIKPVTLAISGAPKSDETVSFSIQPIKDVATEEKGVDPELLLLTDGLGNALHALFDACKSQTVDPAIVERAHEKYRQLRTLMATNRGIFGCKSPDPTSFKAAEEPQGPVLIVDDQPLCRKMMRNMLAPYNLPIEEAADGKTALEMIKKKNYSLVFMDIIMPEMNGRIACSSIRALPDRAGLPIVAASSETITAEEMGPHGFTFRITKPFSLQEIRKILKATFPSRFKEEDK
ncbi:MAG: response regulator [Parachlamydiales bacterium]|nr:response regulator [Parachlamydiales bacterium]